MIANAKQWGLMVLGALVALCWTVGREAPADTPRPNGPESGTEFERQVRPFLVKYCVSCHGSEKPAGKVSLDKLTGNLAAHPAEVDVWSAILEQIETGNMPPKNKPRPNDQEMTTLKNWTQGNLGSAQKVLARKLLRPENGNSVSHEKLFDPKTAVAAPKIAASPARIWRILPATYESKEKGWLANKRPAQAPGQNVPLAPFGVLPEHELKNYAFLYTLQSSEAEGLANNAKILLTWMLDGDPNEKRSLIRNLAKAKEPPTPADVEKLVVESYRDWLGRSPRPEELPRKRDYILDKIKKFGNRDGLLYGLVPIMVHPEAVFHLELGSASNGEPTILTPDELSWALHRATTDRWESANPYERLAREGKLKSRDDVLAVLQERARYGQLARSDTVQRFLEEYFIYPQSYHVFKCPNDLKQQRSNPLFKGFDAAKAFEKDSSVTVTRRILEEILQDDKQVMKRMLTIKTDYLGKTERMQKSELDSLAAWRREADELEAKNLEPQKVKQLRYKAGELERNRDPIGPDRMGVLTQRSWLVAHSTNAQNHPIHRGKWIRERLLGGRVPDVPITVDAALPEDPAKTLRQRMEKTRHAECWKCHKFMDPLGLPFEQWDHFASFRKTELDRPVDITGAIIESGDPKLDGPVASPQELLTKLAESERVDQVFVRFAFRFWMGRNETLDDARTIQDAYKAYKDSDGSMSALLKSLLTSDAFLYRVGQRAR